ncbi:uncharacterized protein LOC128379203 [Scomber japonicus]|uniref:uncharacterized protein LOC128379203 n=1 Tax=Scomber japonicus TaxID=13676 RepID=UPI0023069F1B|nr:uncharacterized protein LOC128379203 [Scomber japonicus]
MGKHKDLNDFDKVLGADKMETEDDDNTAAGEQTELTKHYVFDAHHVCSVFPTLSYTTAEELEESAAETKCGPVNELSEAEHSERKDERTTIEESEITSEEGDASDEKGEVDEVKEVYNESSSDSEQTVEESNRLECTSQSVEREINKLTPELTLVLVGETNSIEIGSKNIFFDHDEQTNVEQFSSKLYDLCGRYISVINMLGLQSIDKVPLNRGIHAFLLLLPNGLHSSQYSSGVQWLEKAFGKESLAYLMTVVTHKSDESCESAVTDLKANSSFTEKRYHTCKNSMMDENEIIALLEKIDVMVSENDPHCYSGLMCDDTKELKDLLDHKYQEEERINSSESQQNPTGFDHSAGEVDEVKEVYNESSSDSEQTVEESNRLDDA